jgi:hypothetical protein
VAEMLVDQTRVVIVVDPTTPIAKFRRWGVAHRRKFRKVLRQVSRRCWVVTAK